MIDTRTGLTEIRVIVDQLERASSTGAAAINEHSVLFDDLRVE